jgi:hypothetical protein
MPFTIQTMTTKELLHQLVDELSEAEADNALVTLSLAHEHDCGDDAARRRREIDAAIIDSYTSFPQEDLGASWSARQSIREEPWGHPDPR